MNLIATMLIGGLWHGASWLFVIWGGLHGVYLFAERLICKTRIARLDLWDTRIAKLCVGMMTYMLVCLAWVFFRAKTLSRASDILLSLFNFRVLTIEHDAFVNRQDYLCVLAITFAILGIHWSLRDTSLERAFTRIPLWIRAGILGIMVYCIMTAFAGEDRAFIYFQF